MSEAEPQASESGVLVFKAAAQRLALPLSDIVEIIRPCAITRVPQSPPELLGIANFRGTVVPIVSANALLGGERGAASANARIVIVRRKTIIGLMVDEVSALARSSEVGRLDLNSLLSKSFRFQARPDRKLDAELQSARTSAEDTQHDLVFLAFEIAHQEFGLAINQVEGVAVLPPAIARLPRTDQAMLGAAEIDGALVSIVSLRVLLGFSSENVDQSAARVILVRIGEALVGVVVDGVKEILRVRTEALDVVPTVLTRAKGEAQIEAICRLDKGRRLVSILATTKLFDADTVTRILETKSGAALMPEDETKLGEVEQFMVFQLGNEIYGLPIGSVDEVVRCPENLTRVPMAPAFVRGIMNLRGKAVPVVDQRQRFSAEGGPEGNRQRVIVVTVGGLKTGFLVDKILEVLSLPASEISPALELADETTSVIDRIAMIEREGHMILLVDPKALLDRAEQDVLESISKTSEAPLTL